MIRARSIITLILFSLSVLALSSASLGSRISPQSECSQRRAALQPTSERPPTHRDVALRPAVGALPPEPAPNNSMAAGAPHPTTRGQSNAVCMAATRHTNL